MTPEYPVVSNTALLVPAINSPNFNLQNPPASPSPSWAILQNGLAYFFGLILSGGTILGPDYIINTSGIFFYTGTPTLGNLVSSSASVGGVDQFGNVFQAGDWVYGTNASIGIEVESGTATLLMVPNGLAHASNTPPSIFAAALNVGAANEIQELIAFSGQEIIGGNSGFQLFSESADGTIPAQGKLVITGATILTWTATGLAINGNGQFTSNVSASFYLMPAIAAPAPVTGNGQIFANTSGAPSGITEQGVSGTLPLSQIDISNNSVGNTTNAGLLSKAWSIPGGDAAKGTTYTIKARAAVLMGATATETLTIGIAINGLAGTLVPLASLGATFNGSTLSAAYDIPLELTLIVDAVGANTPEISLSGPLGNTSANRLATNSANMSGHSVTATWNKANVNTMALYAQWGGTGGAAQTVGTISSRLYRECV